MSCWRDCANCGSACLAFAQLYSLNSPEAKMAEKTMLQACKACAEICDQVG